MNARFQADPTLIRQRRCAAVRTLSAASPLTFLSPRVRNLPPAVIRFMVPNGCLMQMTAAFAIGYLTRLVLTQPA